MRRVVLLPGINETAQRFREAGFEEIARRHRAPIALEYGDYEIEMLTDRAAADRVVARILACGRAHSADRPWLAGVSLGGYVALHCARIEPAAIAGVCLIAPYLGARTLIREIASAAGLDRWDPGTSDDDDRLLWRFLRDGAGGVPLFLGAGTDDRFASAHALLAPRLPRSRRRWVEGGHGWSAWTEVWKAFVESGCWQ